VWGHIYDSCQRQAAQPRPAADITGHNKSDIIWDVPGRGPETLFFQTLSWSAEQSKLLGTWQLESILLFCRWACYIPGCCWTSSHSCLSLVGLGSNSVSLSCTDTAVPALNTFFLTHQSKWPFFQIGLSKPWTKVATVWLRISAMN